MSLNPVEFASSVRGQYIISQALCLAIDKMNDDTAGRPHLREDSNIADMEYLRDELFPIYKAIQAVEKGTSVPPVDVLEAAIASLNDDGVYQECEECGGNLYRCDCLQKEAQNNG